MNVLHPRQLRHRLRRLERREAKLNADHRLSLIREDAGAIFGQAGIAADEWQLELARSKENKILCLASRQRGKSFTAAAKALTVAFTKDNALILLLSPTLRQSTELFQKIAALYNTLGRPVRTVRGKDNATRLDLANGSRIISLPGTECTIRGYSSVDLLVIDEAARVEDSLFYSVMPMLAVSKGQCLALTTPWGKRGWFWESWEHGAGWDRIKVVAEGCPRIDPTWLAQQRIDLGEMWYRQEFECSFESMAGALIAEEDIQAALVDGPGLFERVS